jgi:hypothetical protein
MAIAGAEKISNKEARIPFVALLSRLTVADLWPHSGRTRVLIVD